MAPVRQSTKARLHSNMLKGLCKAAVLTTTTIATRLLKTAKTQNGTFTAAKTTSLMKAAVSLTGITSSVTRPQMLLFQSEIILICWTGSTNCYALCLSLVKLSDCKLTQVPTSCDFLKISLLSLDKLNTWHDLAQAICKH